MKKYLLFLSTIISSQVFSSIESIDIKEFEENFKTPPKGTKVLGSIQTDFFIKSMLLIREPLNDQNKILIELKSIYNQNIGSEKYSIIKYEINCKTQSQNNTSFFYDKNGKPIISGIPSKDYSLLPYQIKRTCSLI
ncbi:hypothetical protein [Acinetobacter faecalis]|uniref:hypothetical protein n=1 Tax=Acinetobacter faecalis TaxID=2665161 RepID=UPI002A9121AC|nr:hypothetical protein [Acinetobacter faecalis]MDY6450509.1 hypothetical protein [Acinetobacter faecalis]